MSRDPFLLDPSTVFLNHGSFGSCPAPVLAEQSRLRERLERDPIVFFLRDLEPLLDEVRGALASVLGARPADLGFVPNATTGVNAVLASLPLAAGDEIVISSHGYNAVNNAARRWAERCGAGVVEAVVPFPVEGPAQVLSAIEAALSPRTRLCVIDHVTSPTGMVLPVRHIVELCDRRGIDVLVDGAHAPGMLPLDLEALGAAYYTGNLHKWLCAPKGAAFLWVREDKQATFQPLVTSHGRNATRTDRSRFLLEMDWQGTDDPTAILCVPHAIRFVEALSPRGLPGVMAENRELVLWARQLLLEALPQVTPCPVEMIGSLASLVLPHSAPPLLADRLYDEHRVQVPVFPFGERRLVRVSAQRYNTRDDYRALVLALQVVLTRT